MAPMDDSLLGEPNARSRTTSQRWLKVGAVGPICVLVGLLLTVAVVLKTSATYQGSAKPSVSLASLIATLPKRAVQPSLFAQIKSVASGPARAFPNAGFNALRGFGSTSAAASLRHRAAATLASQGSTARFESGLTETQVNQLERLKTMTSVVADTGDFGAIQACSPEDCTTNPSLLLQAARMEKFQVVLQEAASDARAAASKAGVTDKEALITDVCDRFAVKVGVKLLEMLPANGRVSTEVDANLSFDTEASIAKAHKIIALYEAEGVSKERILVKMASTWESIQACRVLEKEGIHCNMTLLFSIVQAIGCAEAGAFLISPFVGRIMDWYKKSTGKEDYTSEEDPGVQSVRRIYRYYKKYGHDTIVMGASFRNKGEITGLAGCDKLTIAPKFLEELALSAEPLERVLEKDASALDCTDAKMSFGPDGEKTFRWAMNEDAMATEKLSEGIRLFAVDGQKLRDYVKQNALS